MAIPGAILGAISIGSSIIGAGVSAKAAKTNAEAQKLGLQGQMLQTMGQAFGFETQAQQYGYQANINKYQAGVARMNKIISEQNAAYARDVGEIEATQSGMKSRAELGEMTVAQGASGLAVSGASATRVRESMIELGYYNQKLLRASAAKKAYGFEVEATQYKAQSDVYDYTAQQNEAQALNSLKARDIALQAVPLIQKSMDIADTAGNLGVLGSLVGGAGSVAGKWFQGQSVGWGAGASGSGSTNLFGLT